MRMASRSPPWLPPLQRPCIDGQTRRADEKLPTLKPSDRRDDRLQGVLDVFEMEATRQKADDEHVSTVRPHVELQSGEIVQAVNKRRLTEGLVPLGRATVQDLIRAAVATGSLEAIGTKGLPRYRLGRSAARAVGSTRVAVTPAGFCA
jgi:hypothetical protein